MSKLRESILHARLARKVDRHRRLGLAASLAIFKFSRLFRKYNEDQPRDALGRWVETRDEDEDFTTGSVRIDSSNGRTGNDYIDHHTRLLERKVAEIMERVGEGSGAAFGSLVHKELADWVRASGVPGLSAEQSWLDGIPIIGSLLGSKRPDVVLRETNGNVVAVWDLKTGNAELWRPRVAEIRQSMGIGSEVPIIRLSVRWGSALKAAARMEIDRCPTSDSINSSCRTAICPR